MNQVKVLWTGGWDSTFRVVELSRQNVEIQPIYIIDPNRESIKQERIAMKNIVEALKQKSETKAKFLEIKEIKLEDIPQDKEITDAYIKINKETGLGSQHEWLARLAKKIPDMEIGTEKGTPETSRIIDAIQKFTKMKFVDGVGIVDKPQSTKEGCLILGNFRYPIIQRTEKDMLKQIKEWHYEDVMKLIWFCHTPIKGVEPCGLCHPCHVKIESGMEFLLTKKALNNYKKQIKIRKIFGKRIERIYTKIKMKINK